MQTYWLTALGLVLVWVLFTLWCYRHALVQRFASSDFVADGFASKANSKSTIVGHPVWVVYASESGHARELARSWFKLWLDHGLQIRLMTLNQASERLLRPGTVSAEQPLDLFLFISTTGDGDAPINGRHFLSRTDHLLATPDALAGCHFSVLALGDRSYPHFCRFGLEVEQRMLALGASSLAPTQQVDNLNEDELSIWYRNLSLLPGFRSLAEFDLTGLDPASSNLAETAIQPADQAELNSALVLPLSERHQLNIGSTAAPVHELRFQTEPSAKWQAGDIARLQLGGEQTRDYSIASTPSEQYLTLLVREHHYVDEDGHERIGLGSGLLCRDLALGETLPWTLVTNPGFHAPPDDAPLILIGNGTGLAGLRAHLQQRYERGAKGGNWLIFGERHSSTDQYWAEELAQWQQEGHLQRLDLAFSRESHSGSGDTPATPSEPGQIHASHAGYVQDALTTQAQRLAEWIDLGAYLYVCGNRSGMAAGVDDALRSLLGDERVEDLDLNDRYRRDVY